MDILFINEVSISEKVTLLSLSEYGVRKVFCN